MIVVVAVALDVVCVVVELVLLDEVLVVRVKEAVVVVVVDLEDVVTLVRVAVVAVVEGQAICSHRQHQSFFLADQASSQLWASEAQSNHSVVVAVLVVGPTVLYAIVLVADCEEVLVVLLLTMLTEVAVLMRVDVAVEVIWVWVLVNVEVVGHPSSMVRQHQSFFF